MKTAETPSSYNMDAESDGMIMTEGKRANIFFIIISDIVFV